MQVVEPRLMSALTAAVAKKLRRPIGVTQNVRVLLRYAPAFLLAVAPAFYTCIAIYLYSVDLPQWDEWSLSLLHEKFANGTLRLVDLFAQQNEYRQFFPNLVFVALGWVTKGDPRYLMYLSFLSACLTAYNIYRLSALTLHVAAVERWWLLGATNLLIFSPVPAENWLQGQQLIYFIPAAALTTGLHLTFANTLRPRLTLLLCGLLSLVSTFSSANGITCWVLLAPALYRVPTWSTNRQKTRWLFGWLAGFALSATIYLIGYKKPGAHPNLSYVLAHPAEALIYWLSLLGGPFGFRRIALSVAAGALMLGLYVLASWSYLRHAKHNADPAGAKLCWLLLGAYSLITAALITFGRAGFGVSQSLSTRYVTFTVFLPIALVYLFAYAHTLTIGSLAISSASAHRVAIVVLFLIGVHLPIYVTGIRQMSALQVKGLHDKVCVQLINVVADDCQTQVSPDVEDLRAAANRLNHLSYLRPPLLTDGRLREFATGAEAAEYGSFIELASTGPGEYTARGVAVLPYRHDAADAVVLACENRDGEAKIVAVANMVVQRDMVSALLGRGVYGDTRWYKTFDTRTLPAGSCNMTAWAIDAYTGKAFRIPGTHSVLTQAPASGDR